MNIGKSIEISLINKGMKKKELASELGVNNATISRWCTGDSECPMPKVQKMSGLFGLSVSEFIALGE